MFLRHDKEACVLTPWFLTNTPVAGQALPVLMEQTETSTVLTLNGQISSLAPGQIWAGRVATSIFQKAGILRGQLEVKGSASMCNDMVVVNSQILERVNLEDGTFDHLMGGMPT